MNIDKFHTIKINNDYKYYRTILNLSPDGSSKLIQRRLYTTIECSYDNLSPNLLQLYVIIYGIKGEAKNNLDFIIYDYERATEVANNQFQLHVPINMNNNKIMGLPGFFPSYIEIIIQMRISKSNFINSNFRFNTYRFNKDFCSIHLFIIRKSCFNRSSG